MFFGPPGLGKTTLAILIAREMGVNIRTSSGPVLEKAAAGQNPIGRASVFRTLELLTGLAIIRPTYLRPGAPNYIVMPESGHHAHIICPQCSRVIEIDECEIDGLLETLGDHNNVQITGHLLELYGKCSQCA